MQGDIVGIVDSTGNTVATYTYDAWGNILTANGDLAEINPIRYRGCYYDDEINMYYLQSRYYDQNVGRFVNSDDVSGLGYSGTILSYNLLTYCENEPIMNIDSSGFAKVNLSNIKYGVFAYWARSIAKFWLDGYEKKLISLSRGSVTLYLSLSVSTTIGKLKSVSVSSNSITIASRGFETELGRKKLTYSLSKSIGEVTIKASSFIGSRGYGLGLSLICPIYSPKNKIVGYVSFNIVTEVTYAMLAFVAVTVAAACVVIPAVVPMAKQMIKTLTIMASPTRVISYAYTFYSLGNKLAGALA